MFQVTQQQGFDELVNLSDELIQSINKSDPDVLLNKVSEYTGKMENYFLSLKLANPVQQNLTELKQLMSIHEKMINLFNEEKNKVSGELKNLHAGKAMQKTYPKK